MNLRYEPQPASVNTDVSSEIANRIADVDAEEAARIAADTTKANDNAVVKLTGDQTLDGKKLHQGQWVIKNDGWVDMRAYGNYDPIAADNTPAVSGAFSQWATSGGCLLVPGGTTNFNSLVTFTRKQGEIKGLHGLNSILNYTGPGGVPALRALNCAHLNAHDFKIVATPSSGQVTYLLDFQYNSATNTGGGVTRNRVSNLYCGAASPSQVLHVIGTTLAAGSADGNNDLMTLDHITAVSIAGYLFDASGSQSKGHTLINCNVGVCAGLINTYHPSGVDGGHFTVVGGNVSNSTGPVVQLGSPREGVGIFNLAAESCSQFLVQPSGNTTNWNVWVSGGSSIGGLLHPSNVEMDFNCAGPFIVENFLFQRSDAIGTPVPNSSIKLSANPSLTRCAAIVRGCAWMVQGSAAYMDSIVNRQAGTNGGHVVHAFGNSFRDGSNNVVVQNARNYGQPSFLGAFATASRPTSANDLTPGDSYYDTGLQMPFRWTGLAWRSLYTEPVSTVLAAGAAQTLVVVD